MTEPANTARTSKEEGVVPQSDPDAGRDEAFLDGALDDVDFAALTAFHPALWTKMTLNVIALAGIIILALGLSSAISFVNQPLGPDQAVLTPPAPINQPPGSH